MATSTIVVFGSGPGIGVSVAKLFAEEHFNRIVLCARDASHLDSEKSEVQNAAEKAGKDVKVIALPTDLANVHSLRNAFKAIEKLGPLGCVYHNAARIKPSEPLSTTIEEIEEDFKVCFLLPCSSPLTAKISNVLPDRKPRPLYNSPMGDPPPQKQRTPLTLLLCHQQCFPRTADGDVPLAFDV